MARTSAQNRAIYQRRKTLAQQRGFGSYGEERRAREGIKKATGIHAKRGITQRQMISQYLHKNPALVKVITGFQPMTHLDWTEVFSP